MRNTRNTIIKNKRNARTDLDRIEKIGSGDKKKDQVDEISSTENKKISTVPLKKRPLPMKKILDRQPIETFTPTIAVGRSKRTPKPNPKYTNETMVTSQLRSKKSKYETSDEDEDLVDGDDLSEPSTELDENNSDDTFNEFENDEEDADEDYMENFANKKGVSSIPQKRLRLSSPNRITTSTPLGRPGTLRGRPKKILSPLEKFKYSAVGQANKRNVDFEKKKQKVESTIIERNKRLNIELYDSNEKISAKSQQSNTKEFRTQEVRQINSRVRPKAVTPDPVSIPTSDTSKRNTETITKRVGNTMSPSQKIYQSKKDDRYDDIAKTSTLDDFETMPTFTIVNVNDIMNNREILVADSKGVNRRRENKVAILTESSDEEKCSSRKPFPPTRSSNFLNNNNLSKADSKKGEKAAPIILNSLLGNNVSQVSPKINKNILDSKLRDVNSHRSPLNFQNQHHKSLKHLIPSSQKVVIEREGDQLVKKITCFESWYIIAVSKKEPPPPPKNLLDISLVEIGNSAKEIKLPSSNWKHKVTLQQIPENVLARGDYEEYTGELDDQTISEEDRDKYQPTSVMFKRAASEKEKARLPYDRAVIFKNKTFYTNIDGKNIRLVGAPFKISSLEDVEILIQLIDELPLDSQFVEPTTTI